MIFEPVTGISFPPPAPGASASAALGISILEGIASCTSTYLVRGGYLGDEEKVEVLNAYREHIAGLSIPVPMSNDFLIFAAEYQAQKHAIPRDGEIQRMHKTLRQNVYEPVHFWSLGAVPDPSHSLYVQCPALRGACEMLQCPAICANDDIVHVAALNPFAGMVAAEWIRHDAALTRFGERPFVFTLMVEFTSWTTLRQRHFDP